MELFGIRATLIITIIYIQLIRGQHQADHIDIIRNACSATTPIDENIDEKKLFCNGVTIQWLIDHNIFDSHTIYNEIYLEKLQTTTDDRLFQVKNENSTEYLTWIKSSIKTIHLDALLIEKRFYKLKYLNLSENTIQDIRREHFNKLKSIKLLDLSYNNLSEFRPNVFNDIATLTTLNISNNQLKSIVTDDRNTSVFDSLVNLVHLDLSRNYIDDLPHRVFNGLTELKYLSLAYNRLNLIPFQIFKVLTNIEVLDVSHNQLVLFSDNFFVSNKKLQVLLFNSNIIERLSRNALFGLKELHTLDLSSNQLINIDRNAFDSLINLNQLNLSGNPFAIISSTTFSNLTQLCRLDLSRNNLKYLPNGIFASQYALNEVIIEDTAVEKLSNWISRKDNTIDKTVLSNLKICIIRNNRNLVTIDPITFRNVPAIEHLDLSNNNLVQLPREIGDLNDLVTLNISGNKLLSIPHQMGTLKNLKELNLIGNDFNCDCHMYWIVGFLDEIAQTNSDLLNLQLSKLKCHNGYPGEMLRVLQHLHCIKPVIIQYTESTMHQLRSDAILECSFSGNPAPDIIWVTPSNVILNYNADPDARPILYDKLSANSLKHGQRIEFQKLTGNSANFSAAAKAAGVSLLDNGSLIVHNISRKDSGLYTCYGYNIMGNSTGNIR